MIACVSPSSFNFHETLKTLRYAQRAKKIRNRPVIQVDPVRDAVMQLKREVKGLRRENAALRAFMKASGGSVPNGGDVHSSGSLESLKGSSAYDGIFPPISASDGGRSKIFKGHLGSRTFSRESNTQSKIQNTVHDDDDIEFDDELDLDDTEVESSIASSRSNNNNNIGSKKSNVNNSSLLKGNVNTVGKPRTDVNHQYHISSKKTNRGRILRSQSKYLS
jgi:hypothetical protein